ncbi:MAG TPA: HET-C-related protein [Microlunatus sp.]|nr:HET-C-related protein [Microlunatus sp.]
MLDHRDVIRLQALAGNRSVQRALAPSAPVIQRYQAGEEGHGGIEQRALTSVGFSDAEAGQIYFGNWLRDFSQLNSSGNPMAQNDLLSLFTVIRVLGWGEWNREVSPGELGTYVPSEHLDNPDAAGLSPGISPDKRTVEDPAVRAMEHDPDPAKRKIFQDALDRLSPEQRKAYDDEEAHRSDITAAAKRSGLPEYVERGKFHAKSKLSEAISLGRGPAGFAKMGDALHAVEDYFSHSNFIDVCLWTLHTSGVTAAEPYVKAMVERMHGTNPALIGGVGPSGQPNIVTGTYSPGANDWVSRLELLKAQLHSGEFAKAFLIGLIRLGTIKAADVAGALGRDVGSSAGAGAGLVLGGAGGAVVGGIEGAATGAETGARAGYRGGRALGGSGLLGDALGLAGGLLGGAGGLVGGGLSGLVEGGVSGATHGAEVGADLGGSAGEAVGRGVVTATGTLLLGEAEIAILLSSPLLKVAMLPYLAAIDPIIEHFADQQTTQSGVEAASRGLTGPTHSQIAKDAPDHPLFSVSVALAEEVDRQIGTAIQAAWAGRTAAGATGPVTEAEAKPVTDLVDKYVSQPASDPWWQATLTGALK